MTFLHEAWRGSLGATTDSPSKLGWSSKRQELRYYKKVKLTAAARCTHYHALASILYQPGVLCISLSSVKEFENED